MIQLREHIEKVETIDQARINVYKDAVQGKVMKEMQSKEEIFEKMKIEKERQDKEKELMEINRKIQVSKIALQLGKRNCKTNFESASM